MTENERTRILEKIEDAICRVETEHLYKIPGEFSTYCEYNKGMGTDCADRIRGEILLALQGDN